MPLPYGRNRPLCGSRTTESDRSIPLSTLRPCSVSRKNPPYAASTWNQQPARSATVAMASSGSTAPVSVVPAAAMTSHGLRPRPRSAADRLLPARRAACGSARPSARGGAAPRPARRCGAPSRCSDGPGRSDRRRRRRSPAPVSPWASRAVAMADRVAMLPPDAMCAARRRRIAHQVGHPADQHVLHPHRTGAGEEDARVLVADRGEVVAERGVVEPAARDVGEVAARRGVGSRAGPRRAPGARWPPRSGCRAPRSASGAARCPCPR